jgi:tetratricopeptide (TPR) repeat protein
VTASLFSSYEAEARRIRQRVVASWYPDGGIIIPGTEQVTGVEKSATPDVVKQAPFDTGPVKVKVRLADAVKVGKEGYIHGFICVRPPCGKYSEAVHNTANGKVTHEGAKIGQQLKKEAGDSGYSIRHHGADGSKTTLKGQYQTRHDAAGAVALYHNTSALHDAANGVIKDHLGNAKAALANGDHEAALKHLDKAVSASHSAGNINMAEHIKSTRVSLASHPHPVNAPKQHGMPDYQGDKSIDRIHAAIGPLDSSSTTDGYAEDAHEALDNGDYEGAINHLGTAMDAANDDGDDELASHADRAISLIMEHQRSASAPSHSTAPALAAEPLKAPAAPQHSAEKLPEIAPALKPATSASLSPADEVKQLPLHQQEAYRFRTANSMSHEKALAYAKFVPEPGATQAGKDPYAGMSSHAKSILMGIQGGKVSTGSHGTSGPPMKSKIGSVQDAQRAAVAHMAPLSHGVGDPEGQKVSKATGEVRFGHSNGLVGHIKKVPGGHQAVSAKTGELTGVHAKRVDALIELAGIHNKKIDEEKAAAEQKAAPGSSVAPAAKKAPEWSVSHHEEEYAGFPSGNIQDIHMTRHNGHQIMVDEPHYGDGWRFSIMSGDGNRRLSSSPEPNRSGYGSYATGYSSAEQAKAAAIQESNKLAAGGKPTWNLG